jgi:hypothetical protein
MADVERVEKLRLRGGIGVEDRLELAQPVEQCPGRGHRSGDTQKAFEQEGRPQTGGSQPGREGGLRQSEILRAVTHA